MAHPGRVGHPSTRQYPRYYQLSNMRIDGDTLQALRTFDRDGPLLNFSLDDAASSCRQLIRSSRKLLSQEAHLEGDGAPVFFSHQRDFDRSGLLFLLLRALGSTPTTFSVSCLVTASGPPSVNTSTQGQHLRPLRPRTRGLPLCSKPLIQDPSDNARGLPQGSRPNTAPGPHAHSRPAPTNRWDLPRF